MLATESEQSGTFCRRGEWDVSCTLSAGWKTGPSQPPRETELLVRVFGWCGMVGQYWVIAPWTDHYASEFRVVTRILNPRYDRGTSTR